jgi:CHRD domain-containing protein
VIVQSAKFKVQSWIVVLLSVSLVAQTPKTYRARLSTVPIDVAMQSSIAGKGSVTATLDGTKLTINGSYEGLKTPATVARLHRGYRGVRGPSFADLKVSGGTSGTITGTVDLTPSQVGELSKSLFYVQLHSEKAPDGNLWGWLLPEAKK